MLTTAYFTASTDSTWTAYLDDGRQFQFRADGEPADTLGQLIQGRQVSDLIEEVDEHGNYHYSMMYLVK